MTKGEIELPLNMIVSPFVVGQGVPVWWEPLFRSCCNGSIFTSGIWIQTWLDVYGNNLDGQWVRWEHRGVVVGGCLLVTRLARKWSMPMRLLFLNATGETAQRAPTPEYNDILYVSGYEEPICADATRLVRSMRWSQFHVLGYRENALVARVISGLPVAVTESDKKAANFVNLVTLSEIQFESSLVGSGGSRIRRNRRLYEKAEGNIRVVRARNLDEAMVFFNELATLHNLRWRTKGQRGTFNNMAVVQFHQRLIGRLWPLGCVDLISVRSAKNVIGYLYNFTTEKKVYFFQSGFVYEVGSKLSPGLLTHTLCIEHYRQNGFCEYDFLAGDAQYKRTLAKEMRFLYWTVAYRNTLWSRLQLLARRVKWTLQRRFHRSATPFTAD